jgi:26 proteasome complex subunit DSS1
VITGCPRACQALAAATATHDNFPEPPHKPTPTTATMSGTSQAPTTTAKHDKATVPDPKNGEQPLAPEKKAASLEEDDEFEDFPVEDWTEEETQIPNGNAHLWEESWDDDDTNEDFAVQLR